MPLRHLIVLIANAHRLCLDLEFLSSSLALEGVPNLTIRTLCSVPNQLCAVTFYNGRFLTMPSTCSTDLRLRKSHKAFARYGATPSSSLAVYLKTSFSRLDPIPRGQATVIRSSIRSAPKSTNNDDPERQASFLPPSPPSFPAG